MSEKKITNNRSKGLIFVIIITLFIVLLSILFVQLYVEHSTNKKIDKKEKALNKTIKLIDYQNIKTEVEIIGAELEKIVKTNKSLKKEQIRAINFLLVSDKRFCEDLERDTNKDENKIFDCYITTREKMKQFEPLITDKNISKLFYNKVVIGKSHTELSKDEIKQNKNEAYQTIIDTYKSLFNDYIEQFEYCKNEEIRYDKEREKKQFDTKVILKQNRTLIECYETLKLTEEGLESTSQNLNKKYSQKINKEIKDMAKVFSQNRKIIDDKLVELKTKIN